MSPAKTQQPERGWQGLFLNLAWQTPLEALENLGITFPLLCVGSAALFPG